MQSLPARQPLTCTQFAGITMTDPALKSLADAASAPVYQTPLMITFLISLLCVCSGLSGPAGTLRICVYSPFLGSPDNTANCMPSLSGSSVHFRSASDTISGALLSCFCCPSWARTDAQRQTAANVTNNALISKPPFNGKHVRCAALSRSHSEKWELL